MSTPPDQDARDSQYSRKIGGYMISFMWIVALALATLFIQRWYDKQYNPNQQIVISGNSSIVLQRNRYGHYISNGEINGQKAVFLLDTGATDVAIPGHLASLYGLEPGPSQKVNTANGVISVNMTTLEHVALGPIALRNVPANLNPHMHGDEILLGMSFLKHLNLSQENNQLTISTPQY